MSGGVAEKVVGAVVVTAVVFIGGSYWVGGWIEQGFLEGMEKASKYGFTINVVDYQRGVFGATARTEVSSPAILAYSGGNTVSFVHDIRHGPVLALAAARIRSELQLPEYRTAQISETFGTDPFEGKPPLVIDTTIGWSGEQRHRFSSPKIEAVNKEDRLKLSWGGLDGEVIMNSSGMKASTDLGGLSLGGSEKNAFQLQLGHTHFEFDASWVEGYEFVPVGTSIITLDKLVFNGKDAYGTVRNIDLENLRGTSKASIDDGALATTQRFDIARLSAGGETKESISDIGFTFLYENIDVQSFASMPQTASPDGEEEEEEAKPSEEKDEEDEQAVPPVLLHKGLWLRKPAFSIQDAKARWPEGEFSGDFRIAYVGGGDIDQFSLADLVGELHLRAPRTLAIRLLGAPEAEELEDEEAVEANIEKDAKERGDKRVASMIKGGTLVEKDGTISVDATYKGGELILNGKPAPLENLLELSPF